MKRQRKMITIYKPLWDSYKKTVKKKAVDNSDPTLTISSDLSKYMAAENKKWSGK